MVVVGNFSVCLVNAVTKQPFQEHYCSTPTTSIDYYSNHQENDVYYAEIEPNLEYFVKVQIVDGGGKQRRKKKKVCVQLVVDGIQLESRTIMNRNVGPALLGVLSRKDGVTRKSAFCFHTQQKPPVDHRQQTAAAMGSSAVMGFVTVQFSDPVYAGSESLQEYYKEEFARRASKNATQINQLRSFEGNITELSSSPQSCSSNPSSRETRTECASYQPGRLLGKITIKYGTKLDLIYARVIHPPPLWEFHRLKHGLSPEEESRTVPQYTSKRIKLNAEYDDAGHIIHSPREVELIDLTTTPLSCSSKERESKEYVAESLVSPKRNPSTKYCSCLLEDDNDSMTSVPTLISPD